MEYLASVTFPAAHPSLPGHFPSDPVVPGVLILTEVLHALCRWKTPSVKVVGFPVAKFLLPLRPGQLMKIALASDQEGLVTFECRSGSHLIATGVIAIEGHDQKEVLPS